MINIAICDDEKYYRDYINELVVKYFDVLQFDYHIDIFESGAKFCETGLKNKQYDIVFLDINMEEMDGIETAKRIRDNNSNVFIVFITAFVSYSPEGYKVNAIRYILKNNHNFEDALEECLDTIFEKLNIRKFKMKFDFIDGEKEVFVDDIMFIESRLHKLVLNLYSKKVKPYTLYAKLDDIETSLEEYGFLRIHQSFLVNLKHVNQIHNYKVELITGKDLPIPKPKYKEVKDAFIVYKGDIS